MATGWARAAHSRQLSACLVACRGIATPGQAVIRLDGVPRPYGDQAPSLSPGSGHSPGLGTLQRSKPPWAVAKSCY